MNLQLANGQNLDDVISQNQELLLRGLSPIGLQHENMSFDGT